MTFARMSQSVVQRRGYSNIGRSKRFNPDIVTSLLNTAITREGLKDSQKSFLKRKRSGELQIVKVVNNRLRNTVIITYVVSQLNSNNIVKVYFKRYRKNTIEKFGQPCRETVEKQYNLNNMADNISFVQDVEQHMRVCPDNLKTINEALPIRLNGFEVIKEDSLYAFEIHDLIVIKDDANPLESILDMTLASDIMTKDLSIKVKEIVNYNEISDLVGKWIVMNYKGAFKIKTKEELLDSYRPFESENNYVH